MLQLINNIHVSWRHSSEFATINSPIDTVKFSKYNRMTNFIYDTLFSISTTHIGKQLPFIFICQNVPIMLEWCTFRLSNTHNLDTKHTVGMIHFFSFWYTQSCIIPTLCSWSRMCASERRKLYHTYSIFMFLILCIGKYQKEGNCRHDTVSLYLIIKI
jgi:hypothetical protein